MIKQILNGFKKIPRRMKRGIFLMCFLKQKILASIIKYKGRHVCLIHCFMEIKKLSIKFDSFFIGL